MHRNKPAKRITSRTTKASSSHPAGAAGLSNSIKHGSASHDHGETISGKHYDQPFRGLPAEVRLMIWRYALSDVIRLKWVDFKSKELKTKSRMLKYGFDKRTVYNLKAGTSLGLELLRVNKLVREEFISVGIGKIILDTTAISHYFFPLVWKAIPESIRHLLRGLQLSLFDFEAVADCLKSDYPSTQSHTTSFTHISELRLVIDGGSWYNLAKGSFMDSPQYDLYDDDDDHDDDDDDDEEEKEDYYENFHRLPTWSEEKEKEGEREVMWDERLTDEQRQLCYEDELPSFLVHDYPKHAISLLQAVGRGQIPKCTVLFQNLEYLQRRIMAGFEEAYEKDRISAEQRGVLMAAEWEPIDPDFPEDSEYNGSITFERL